MNPILETILKELGLKKKSNEHEEINPYMEELSMARIDHTTQKPKEQPRKEPEPSLLQSVVTVVKSDVSGFFERIYSRTSGAKQKLRKMAEDKETYDRFLELAEGKR